jgi:hypothetical protein
MEIPPPPAPQRQATRVEYRRLDGDATHCCYCHGPLPSDTDVVVPVVDDYDATTGIYHVYYKTCSAPCAKSFLIASKPYDLNTRLVWQRHLLVDHYGWDPTAPIPCARAWQELKAYGGDMDRDTWLRDIDGVSRVQSANVVPRSVFLELEKARTRDPIDEALNGMFTRGLQRPPEDMCIKTVEQLQASFPECDMVRDTPGTFETFMKEHADELPSDDECERRREAFENEKRLQRKRKREAKQNGDSSRRRGEGKS